LASSNLLCSVFGRRRDAAASPFNFLVGENNMVKRVLITPEAEEVVQRLKAEHGNLLFHQSGGCCDGSAPMCFSVNDYRVGENDVKLGEIAGCAFYMSREQFEYWKHTQLIIDITKGRGASFSLEIPLGVRFLTRSRLFTDEELLQLEPVQMGAEAE
jgi:uncharacterized protein (DUF779 family)